MNLCNKNYTVDIYQDYVNNLLIGQTASHIPVRSCRSNSPRTRTIKFSPPSEQQIQNVYWYDELKTIIKDACAQGVLTDAIVHGSYGDFSQTFFSDLEITLLLPSRTLNYKNEASALAKWISQRLNPFLIKVDPLQHHAAFYLWSDLVEHYNENILPLDAYSAAWSMNASTLNFKVEIGIDQYLSAQKFTQTNHRLLESKKYFFRYGINPYSIKRFLSNFTLLPAFYFQAKGEEVSKKKAIYKMLKIGNSDIHAAIEAATYMRKTWPQTPLWLGSVRRQIVTSSIPSGHIDLALSSLYRNKKVETYFRNDVLPVVMQACSSYLLLGKVLLDEN